MKTREEILDFLEKDKNHLREDFHVIKIGIFGSVAKNTHNANSDIDLIAEFEENTPNLYELKQKLKSYLKQRLEVENIDICRERYIKPIFKQSILKEALYV